MTTSNNHSVPPHAAAEEMGHCQFCGITVLPGHVHSCVDAPVASQAAPASKMPEEVRDLIKTSRQYVGEHHVYDGIVHLADRVVELERELDIANKIAREAESLEVQLSALQESAAQETKRLDWLLNTLVAYRAADLMLCVEMWLPDGLGIKTLDREAIDRILALSQPVEGA